MEGFWCRIVGVPGDLLNLVRLWTSLELGGSLTHVNSELVLVSWFFNFICNCWTGSSHLPIESSVSCPVAAHHWYGLPVTWRTLWKQVCWKKEPQYRRETAVTSLNLLPEVSLHHQTEGGKEAHGMNWQVRDGLQNRAKSLSLSFAFYLYFSISMGHKVSNYLRILQINEVSVKKSHLTAQHCNSTIYWLI